LQTSALPLGYGAVGGCKVAPGNEFLKATASARRAFGLAP